MINKYLILVGRTFIATFILVNFFNIIPIDFSRNVWFLQVSMLFVDTASLMLLGLVCLKLVSLLSLKDNQLINSKKELKPFESPFDKEKEQKYQKNLRNINKISTSLIYFFVLLAFLQFYVVIDGFSQIDLVQSAKINKIEKEFNKLKNKISSESKKDTQFDNKIFMDSKLNEKNELNKILDKEANKGKFLLIRNFIRVFLMSLVWAYGFFKLAKFG